MLHEILQLDIQQCPIAEMVSYQIFIFYCTPSSRVCTLCVLIVQGGSYTEYCGEIMGCNGLNLPDWQFFSPAPPASE